MYIKYILVLFSFFVWSTSVYAGHQDVDKETVKALVEKVKKAAPSQRRLLMNELKMQLRSMHQETRTRVMLDLRRSFNGQQRGEQGNRVIDANMHHQNTMSMTESKHMQEHMTQSIMNGEKPGSMRPPVGEKPGGARPPVGGNMPPRQGTPANIPSSQGVSPQRPQNTPHTPMRGM